MKKVKVNSVSAQELDRLPNIGPVLAKRIIKERELNGDFRRGSDLQVIKGIDVETIEDLEGHVSYELTDNAYAEGGDFVQDIEDKIKKNFWSFVDEAIDDVKGWFVIEPEQKKNKSILTFPNNKKRNNSNKRRSPEIPDYNTGKSKKVLSDRQIRAMAKSNNIDYAAIKAVIQVESSGRGYLDNGNPKILFEGHVFWRELKVKRIDPEKLLYDNSDILYPHWNKRHYRGGMGEYDRLNKAARINKEAALRSTSWGMFQIMGFNYRAAGYDSVESYVKSVYQSEEKQLEAFINFIKNKDLIGYVRNKDWSRFAKAYNGNGYKANRYDERLSDAYRRYEMSSLV